MTKNKIVDNQNFFILLLRVLLRKPWNQGNFLSFSRICLTYICCMLYTLAVIYVAILNNQAHQQEPVFQAFF